MEPQRDQHEFTRLYAQCERDLFRYIFSLVASHDDAADILQETASDLWQKFERYDAGRPFDVWARSFAYRRVLKHFRYVSSGDRQLVSFNQEVIQLLSEELSRHAGVLELRRQALETCLKQLGAGDLQLLKERYWRDANLREFSRQHKTTESKLYGRLRTIRLNLQRCIENTVPDLEQ